MNRRTFFTAIAGATGIPWLDKCLKWWRKGRERLVLTGPRQGMTGTCARELTKEQAWACFEEAARHTMLKTKPVGLTELTYGSPGGFRKAAT